MNSNALPVLAATALWLGPLGTFAHAQDVQPVPAPAPAAQTSPAADDGSRPAQSLEDSQRQGAWRARDRRRQRELEPAPGRSLEALEQQYGEYGLGMPITFMALSGGAGLVSLYVGLILSLQETTYERTRDEFDDSPPPDSTPWLIVGGVGAVGAFVGLVWMLDVIAERRPLGQLIRRMRRERRDRHQFGELELSPTGSGAELRLRF